MHSRVRRYVISEFLNVSHFSGIACHVKMSQETNISSWLRANFESGIETDVVPKEQLWQSFLQTLNTTASGNEITRDQFFTMLGILLQHHDFKAVKTMKNRGKNVGYRCLKRKKLLVKEQDNGNVKASKVMNAESFIENISGVFPHLERRIYTSCLLLAEHFCYDRY